MAKHSYSHGSAAEGGAFLVIALLALFRVVGLVFRVIWRHFFNVFVCMPFLACLLSGAAYVLSVVWQWVDYDWWYRNVSRWNGSSILGVVFLVSIVVFFICCFLVDVYMDDTARIGGEDLTEVMSNKWKY